MLRRFRRAVRDDRGAVLPFANAIFTWRVDEALASLWSDREGTTLLSAVGAAQSNANGYLDLFLMPADYSITITSADGLYTGSEEILVPPTLAEITDSGTSRTLSQIDAGNFITFTSDSDIQVDLELDAGFYFPINTLIHLRQSGAGVITIVAETGVTAEPPGGGTLVTDGEGSQIAIKKQSADNWQVIGRTASG